ncbi:MAG: sugar O-acetyltransferase [Bacteroidales bacterium]|nr:sugar O-acetyltransferase [Bacteroidales bacterium]
MTSEKEKMLSGELYDANYDPDLIAERRNCKIVLHEINALSPASDDRRYELFRKILGNVKGEFIIESPFHCDYGYNIELGENFYMNVNCVILDEAKVTFGDNVFIAPNCAFYTAGHPFDVEQRNRGLEYAKPITVGNNVWIGGNVVVVPGVTIGDNCVIGAGSVVTKDIPANSLAVGNPCKVIREI